MIIGGSVSACVIVLTALTCVFWHFRRSRKSPSQGMFVLQTGLTSVRNSNKHGYSPTQPSRLTVSS